MSTHSKRYNLPLDKFSKVALPLYLDLLAKHEANITKFRTAKDFQKLRLELSNAERSAYQLKLAVEEMEKVKSALSPTEASEFTIKLKPYRDKAIQVLEEFLDFHSTNHDLPVQKSPTSLQYGASNPFGNEYQVQTHAFSEAFSVEEVELEERIGTLETVENLHQEIEDLHDLMSNFASMVETQKPLVAAVETHVENANIDVAAGQQWLAKAEKYKGVFYPLGGAVIGGCVGGPLGLLAGIKVGGIAALGGGIIGFTSGHFLKKKTTNSPKTPGPLEDKEKVM